MVEPNGLAVLLDDTLSRRARVLREELLNFFRSVHRDKAPRGDLEGGEGGQGGRRAGRERGTNQY